MSTTKSPHIQISYNYLTIREVLIFKILLDLFGSADVFLGLEWVGGSFINN